MIEIKNRKALYDYSITDTYEAGLVLTGTEIKSIREGKANLKDSYAIVRNGEVYILNMHIAKYDNGNIGCEFCKYKDLCFMKEYDFIRIKQSNKFEDGDE